MNIHELSDRALDVAAQVLHDASYNTIGTETRYRRDDEIEAAEKIRKDRQDIDHVYALLVLELRDRRIDQREKAALEAAS